MWSVKINKKQPNIVTGVFSFSKISHRLSFHLYLQGMAYVKKGDFDTAKNYVYASLACSVLGVIFFAITCAVVVISPIAYIRIVYLAE